MPVSTIAGSLAWHDPPFLRCPAAVRACGFVGSILGSGPIARSEHGLRRASTSTQRNQDESVESGTGFMATGPPALAVSVGNAFPSVSMTTAR